MKEIVRLTLMPIIDEASKILCGRAHRLAGPSSLHEVGGARSGAGSSHDDDEVPGPAVGRAAPVEDVARSGGCSGSARGPAPFHASPMSWRMNEKPIAVISGARRGWLRSGL